MSNKCYSQDDEEFKFDSLGDLLDQMGCEDELKVGAIYYEADCRSVVPSDFYSVGRILEEMDKRSTKISASATTTMPQM